MSIHIPSWRAPVAPHVVALLALAALSGCSPAPTLPTPTRPDPLDAQAAVPPVAYRSSLPQARGGDADKPVGWRQANDEVARIGGWRAYARESAASAPHAGHRAP